MSTATLTNVQPATQESAFPKYAPYWENDETMNPVLVRVGKRHGDHFDIMLPSGEVREVHLHTLGKVR